MKILHLTDLHYKKDSSSNSKQRDIIKSLKLHLESKEKIDLIFFTGDLVNKGENFNDFIEASKLLFEELVELTSIQKHNLIFCAGNHDVYRDQEMEAIKTHISEKINSNDLLDNFVSKKSDPQFLESCKNIENFNKFILDYYSDCDDIIEKLYSVHKRTINGNKIGIVTLNTAWRSFSKEDRGKLLFPRLFVIRALEEIKDCEKKFLLMHHDIADLTEYNAFEVEDLIYENFHYLFSGHYHKKKQSLHITSHEGIFCCTTPATFTISNTNTKIGYTLIDVDTNTFQVKIANSIYDWQSNIFLDEPIQIIEIPLNEEKKEQNEFRKTLRDSYVNELIKANELFVSGQDENNSKNFIDLFSTPIIKTIPEIDSPYDRTTKHLVDYATILKSNENLMIYGKNKSGKSSLLKKIQLDLLSNLSVHLAIPFYIDFREFKLKGEKLNLLSRIARYYKNSQANILRKLKSVRLVILIDNYEKEMDAINQELEEFLKATPNSSFIAVSDLYIFKSYEKSYLDGIKYSKLFIHDITRNEIRGLINKWPNIPQERKQFVHERIVDIFNQLNIPYNYWTVSLFLWIFEKTNDFNLNNNVELIQLYIDNLLERQKIVFSNVSKLSYENFKFFLGELANHLVTNYYDQVYAISYKQLIDFTDEYRQHNLRFVIDTKEIVDHIIARGIIVKKENDLYSFRLRGVFEYFIAYNMIDNHDFREQVINDNKFYLSFGNELELYSGFMKKDKGFLTKIFSKTKYFLEDIIKKYNELGSNDSILLTKVSLVFDMTGAVSQLQKSDKIPLPPSEQDEMMDHLKPLNRINADVTKKKKFDQIVLDPELFERFIFILSRVFRNTDQIKNENLIMEIFEFIITSYCYFGYYIIDEASGIIEGQEKDDDSGDDIFLKLMTNFIPIIIQISLSNAVGQNNLERIILEKIRRLKQNRKENQYLLFLLYSLLMDLNVDQNINYMDDLLDDITLNILKSSVLIKLYSYLMFKCHNNSKLEKYIRDLIQKVTLKINSKTDLGNLHKRLEEKHKDILMQNIKNR